MCHHHCIETFSIKQLIKTNHVNRKFLIINQIIKCRCYSWGATSAITIPTPATSSSSSSSTACLSVTMPSAATPPRLRHSLSQPHQQIQLLQQNSIYQQQQLFLQQRQQLLSYANTAPKKRSCSCSSQTDLSDIFELFSLGGSTENMMMINGGNNNNNNSNSSPTPSLQNLIQAGRLEYTIGFKLNFFLIMLSFVISYFKVFLFYLFRAFICVHSTCTPTPRTTRCCSFHSFSFRCICIIVF